MNQPQKTPIHKHHIPSFLLELFRLVLLALVYSIAVQVGLVFVIPSSGIPPIWPASGLALAVLMLNPKKRWPAMLAVIFAVSLINHAGSQNSFQVSLSFAAVNALEPALCAWGVTLFRKTRLTFDNIADVFALTGAAVLINGFTALLGAIISTLAFGASFVEVWRIGWVANGLGMMLITPVMMTWAMDPGLSWLKRSGKSFEADLLTIALISFCVLIFGPFTVAEQPILQEYMIFPLLGWLAFRFGPRSMSNALLLIAVIAFWGTLQHYGIFSHHSQGLIEELVYLQVYLNVITFSGLLLSAILAEHKRASETLKTTEANYRSILENAPVGFFQSSLDGRFLTVNPYMAQILGYNSPEEMINSITDIGTDIYANPSVRQELKQLLAEQGQVTDFVNQHRRKDGSIFWASTNVRLVKDNQGKPLHFEGFPQDIDKRIEAEKAIQESREFVQATMDSLSAHICVLEADGTILAVNKAWMDFAGQNAPVNGNVSVGVNYLKMCDTTTGPEAEMAQAFATGIRMVISGERDTYTLEYPCHAPHEQHWFMGRVMRFADETLQRVVIAHENITERKLTENALRESEARLKFSQQVAHVGHWTWDTAENRVVWSDEMYRIFGLDPATFDGDLDNIITQAIHPEDREKVIQSNNTVLTEQKHSPLEYRIIWPDQSVHTVWAEAGENICNADGKIIQLSGIVQDITERKWAEDALHLSQQFTISIADNIPGMLGYWTTDLRCAFANKGYITWFGRTPSEMKGITIQELLGEELFKKNEHHARAALRGETRQFERTITKPNGELSYTWAQYIPHYMNGEIQGFFAVVTDITQLKQDQERLRISEEKWRSLFAILPVGISILDAERQVTDFNPALAEILSVTAEGLRDGAYTERKYLRADGSPMPPEEFPTVRAMRQKIVVQSAQVGIIKEDDTLIWVEISASPLTLPDVACVVVTTDVTRRKQIEQALQRANDRLSLAQRAARAGVWDWDTASSTFNWSPELFDLFGMDRSIPPTADAWFGAIFEQDRQLAKERFGKIHTAENALINNEYRIVLPSNEIRWINMLGSVIINKQGQVERLSGICLDVTARKQAEEALHESERNIRIFFETMTEGMALNEIIYDENGEMLDYRILDVNPAFYNTADFSNTEVIGSLASQLYGISAETIKQFWHEHKNRNTTAYAEMYSLLNQKWFYIATSPFAEGKFVTSFLDITPQKEKEAQLVQANEQLALAQRSAGAGLWEWDMTKDFFNWSPELFNLFGLGPHIIPNADVWLKIIHEQDRQSAAEYLNIGVHHYEYINYEYRIVLPSSEVRWINFLGKTIYNEHNQPQRMTGICIDITARKQTENALLESEARLKGIVVSAMDGIVMIDSSQHITLFNQAAEKMFGFSASQVIGQPLDFILPQEKHNLHKGHIEHFGETGITTRSMSALMDVNAVRSTGESFPIEASISQFMVAGQKFYTAILRDVTQRNEMEESLRASLMEKEALLKEVHHRVKNNLQIVSSLLSMQANSSKDEKVTQALEESKNRVRAMALIHEKLYRSENLEYIQAEEYIPELTNYLSGSLVGHEREDITFDLQIAHVTFDIGRAIPCGMIITELVSNALKYAFKPGEPGMIQVHLEVEEGRIRLMVSDNGVGLPLEIDYRRPDTLGLELVSILSRQLKAELQVIRQPGTTFIISFRN